jgi:alpha-glucosidase
MESITEITYRDDLNQRIGSVTQLEFLRDGVRGYCGEKRFQICLRAAGIIQVSVSRKEEFSPNPYTVVEQEPFPDFEMVDREKEVLLKTPKLRVVLEKEPFRLVFKTPEGRVIQEDEPSFGVSWLGTEVSNYKKLQAGERFLGLGEKTGNLDRRGKHYVNWNTDYFGYGVDADPLYLSTPFYIGLHQGLCYGLYLDNTHKTSFNFGASNDRFCSFSAENGDLDYYFIFGDNVAEIIEHYTSITGRMSMPPLWSLGYQQCRYSYYPESEVLNIAKTFRDKNLPADVIYLDVHYMDAFKVFSFNKERFPDPEDMCRQLKKMGFNVVVILDPGIHIQPDYTPYLEGKSSSYFIKYPDGQDYTGEVWPGPCHFPDFTHPDVRQWWSQWIRFYTDQGISGFWNDMNEPSAWGQAIPPLVEFEFDGRKASLKEARNVYGFQMAKSTFEGAEKATKKRAFNLTRAGFSGIQRYAAVWTGDNVASDEHMLAGIRLINSMGLTGIANCGFDLGGFAGEASPALFARWISIAAFTPFFRGHSMINSRSAEPWTFGEEVEEISRNYLNLRYKLTPYIYAAFHQAVQSGIPLNRSLALFYPWDEHIYLPEFQNEFMFGPSLLVAPVSSDKNICKVYLPEGEWYQFFSGEKVKGKKWVYAPCEMGQLPVYAKAGSFICMQSVTQHLSEAPKSVLHIHVYPGKAGGSYTHYEDDGTSFAYQQDQFYSRNLEMTPGKKEVIIQQPKGRSKSKFKQLKFWFYGLRERPGIRVDGVQQRIKREKMAHLSPLSEFDPLPERSKMHEEISGVVSFSIPNTPSKIVIDWK